jgi:hypothetical protein
LLVSGGQGLTDNLASAELYRQCMRLKAIKIVEVTEEPEESSSAVFIARKSWYGLRIMQSRKDIRLCIVIKKFKERF